MRLTTLLVAVALTVACDSATAPNSAPQHARADGASFTAMFVLGPNEQVTMPIPELNGGAIVARVDMSITGAASVKVVDVVLNTSAGPAITRFADHNVQQANAFFRENSLGGGWSVHSGAVTFFNSGEHRAVVRITVSWE